MAKLVAENDKLKKSGGSRFDLARDTAEDCITGIVGTIDDANSSSVHLVAESATAMRGLYL